MEVAFLENTLKLTPSSAAVAPSGALTPGSSSAPGDVVPRTP
jgi:hypothetical protein